MLSLTYFSTASSALGKDDLVGLLDHVRAKNDALGLTGMLLYSDGSFVQTLEGPDEVVEETFGRIAVDLRHRDVFVALREAVEERAFPTWSMGFREISTEESETPPGFSDYLQLRGPRRQPGGSRAEAFHRAFREFTP